MVTILTYGTSDLFYYEQLGILQKVNSLINYSEVVSLDKTFTIFSPERKEYIRGNK